MLAYNTQKTPNKWIEREKWKNSTLTSWFGKIYFYNKFTNKAQQIDYVPVQINFFEIKEQKEQKISESILLYIYVPFFFCILLVK